ncbi:hypothetical protein [Burkholderia sp. LMG 21824]|uniref:hypothetical protein n=1 Tax=Burkholderia sp. LMG 21824 TaxID=3158172 RepID=UPI003C2CE26A
MLFRFVMDCPERLRGIAFHSAGLFSNSVAVGSLLVRLSADTPTIPVVRLVAGVSHNRFADFIFVIDEFRIRLMDFVMTICLTRENLPASYS